MGRRLPVHGPWGAGPPQQGPRTPTHQRTLPTEARVTGPPQDPSAQSWGCGAPTRSQDTGGLWAAETEHLTTCPALHGRGHAPATHAGLEEARPTSCPATGRPSRAAYVPGLSGAADPSSAGSGWARGQAAPGMRPTRAFKAHGHTGPRAPTTNFHIETTEAQTPTAAPTSRRPNQQPWGGSPALRRGGRPHLCSVSPSASSHLGGKVTVHGLTEHGQQGDDTVPKAEEQVGHAGPCLRGSGLLGVRATWTFSEWTRGRAHGRTNQEPKGEGVGQQTGTPDAAGLGQHLRGHTACTDVLKPSDGDSSSQEAVRPGQRRATCTARLLLPAGPDPPPQLTPPETPEPKATPSEGSPPRWSSSACSLVCPPRRNGSLLRQTHR